MARILLAGFILLILISGGLFLVARRNPSQPEITSSAPTPSPEIKFASSSASVDDRLTSIQNALTILDQRISEQSTSNSDIKQKVDSLQSTVANLQQQTTSGETPSSASPPPAAPSKKPPLYIPLGWTGSSSGLDWASIPLQTIDIAGSDYPGYTSMQFQASLSVYQGNGQTMARILDQDDNAIIFASQISTTSQDYSWISSGSFTLPSSSKTYILQLKSLTGYSAQIQDARIKINF